MKLVPGDKKVTRRNFVAALGTGGLGLVVSSALESKSSHRDKPAMENRVLRLVFNGSTGMLAQIVNKLTNEAVMVDGDEFVVVAKEFSLSPENLRLQSIEKKSEELVEVSYRDEGHTVVAAYRLGPDSHFLEKYLTVTSPYSYRLTNLVVSKLSFSGLALKVVKYPYQNNIAYFARSAKGGLFLGVELPSDNSSLAGDGSVTLGYRPSLKVKGGERLESEPIFLGVYKRRPADIEEAETLALGFGQLQKVNHPLQSESEAMVAMTSTIMGPPRHGLVSLACGWWCEMEHYEYQAKSQVKGDMRSIDFLAECGIDGFTDSHPWSGDTEKMNALGPGDRYVPSPLAIQFLEYAKEKKMSVVFWPTMNNTNPWWAEKGRPFRSDRADWLMPNNGQMVSSTIAKELINGNCIANESFCEWIVGIHLDGMLTGYFNGWVMDGDFFGGGGTVVPVNCTSDQHDHLPGDSNYACGRALNRMAAKIRETYPNVYLAYGRPPMDLGIWSSRQADAVFTIDEMGVAEPLPGLSGLPVNVMYGDKIRRWSRIRVRDHFFPHYLDWPQVFVGPQSMNAESNVKGPDWPSEKIDYVMLSALSSSPNLLLYLPTKLGIPVDDKVEIRKWLDWGRKNIEYLLVRKDLPQSPAAGKVDGSAHMVGDKGLVFLFNPNPEALTARFTLNSESVGLTSGTRFEVAQTYPAAETKQQLNFGTEVAWGVPPQTSVVLAIGPSIG